MIDLPIAERELRIGARSERTYRSRRNTAGVAAIVFFWLYWMLGMHGGAAGTKVFGALSVLCFVYTLFAGIILASDCVSSEKREGTLGLLFLTSLKPHDIVAGNILATSLKAFYGLLAAFPILGISFVMGGVSYGEFARVCLTLISTLLFSLAFSLCVSCLSEKHLIATTRAMFGLLFFNVMVPVGCLGLRRLLPYGSYSPGFIDVLELFSPSLALDRTSSSSLAMQHDFWWSLLIINSMSWILLAISCFVLPRVWKDRTAAPGTWVWMQRFRRRRCERWRDPARIRLLHRNPFYWLTSRRSFESIKSLAGSLVLCALACFVGRRYLSRIIGGKFSEFVAVTIAWGWATITMHLVLQFKFAALSSHRFGEDRKSGALELLLVTPLSVRQILRGQWLALRRQLGGPILAILFMHGLMFWAFLTFCGMEEEIPGDAWEVLKVLWSNLLEFNKFLVPNCIGLTILGSALAVCLNWMALGWVGMWVGLRARRTAMATWFTLALVLFPPLPIFAVILFIGDWLGFSKNPEYWAWFCISLGFGLEFLNAIILSVWCWHNLRRKFRSAAANRFQARATIPRVITIRLVRRFALGTAGAALLLLLFYQEEKWRGLRAWHQLEQEFSARGQKLMTKPAIPPGAPNSENFGASAIFKPLFDYKLDEWGGVAWRNNPGRLILERINLAGQEQSPWPNRVDESFAIWMLKQSTDFTKWQNFYRTNANFRSFASNQAPAMTVLKALSLFDPALDELEKSSQLRYARFPIHYEERWFARTVHREFLRNAAQILALRAVAKLELGENDAALADIEFCLRLTDAFRVELGLYPRNVRRRMLLSALQPVWEGLARHRWSEANLKILQGRLPINLLEEYPRAIREEAIMMADIWNWYTDFNDSPNARLGFPSGLRAVARFYPQGWKYLNQSGLLRFCEDELIPLVDPAAHRVFVPNERALERAASRSGVIIDPLFHMVGQPPYAEVVKQFAQAQVALDEAVIACALERWRQSHGAFPSSLERLTPDYIKKLPTDPITSQSYKYRRMPNDQFLLYSVGWNGRDDGGQIVSTTAKPPELNLDEGDWVWSYDLKPVH